MVVLDRIRQVLSVVACRTGTDSDVQAGYYLQKQFDQFHFLPLLNRVPLSTNTTSKMGLGFSISAEGFKP